MKVKDTWEWNFDATLTEESRVECDECKEASPLSDWSEGETDCELCGGHSTMICPICHHGVDHVWAKPFHVRTEQ